MNKYVDITLSYRTLLIQFNISHYLYRRPLQLLLDYQFQTYIILVGARQFYNLLRQQHGERAIFYVLAKLVWHSVNDADI